MPADILIITPSSSLGENIRRALEETSLYRIHVVNNKASAVVRANEVGAPLAMLDLALGDNSVQDVAVALRTVRPGVNLIILCDDNVTPPSFDNLRPWILVRKPFRMANFMTAISQPPQYVETASASAPVPVSAPQSETSETKSDFPWLNDPTKAAQHLTRLTLESAAQAALITRKNDLWAYAGGLSQSAAKEIAHTVTRNWDGQKGSDLLRFIRLESTKAEHMLYATRLATDIALAFVFDAETPFSTIRNQASQLVADLDKHQIELQSSPTPYPVEDNDGEDAENIPPISDILTDIPSPNPPPAPARQAKKFDPNETRVASSLSDVSVFSREPTPAIRINSAAARKPTIALPPREQSQTALDDIEVTAPSRPQPRPKTPVASPTSDADVTRESATTDAARKLTIEPISAGLYHLTYACLLVPRFPSHHITGDLSDRLSEWLPNICIAFGWRLEYLSVRPEYLQWVVNVQPNTSPGYLMRVMRQQTSDRVFGEFVRFKKDNPSGDFWAPGYLIMGGTQPHPPQLVSDYIRQIRQRQGQELKTP